MREDGLSDPLGWNKVVVYPNIENVGFIDLPNDINKYVGTIVIKAPVGVHIKVERYEK